MVLLVNPGNYDMFLFTIESRQINITPAFSSSIKAHLAAHRGTLAAISKTFRAVTCTALVDTNWCQDFHTLIVSVPMRGFLTLTTPALIDADTAVKQPLD